MAAMTTRMRLGTSLVVPAFHNPIRLAEDVATLPTLSNGRSDLGLGLGYLKRESQAYGQRLEKRVGLLKGTVEVCVAPWLKSHFGSMPSNLSSQM